MDLKEILERNQKAHHRLGVITKKLFDTLSDGHHTSLRMTDVNEMMSASFEILKESDILHSYISDELSGGEKAEEVKPATKKAVTKKAPAKKAATKKVAKKAEEPAKEEAKEEAKPVAKKAAAKPAAKKEAGAEVQTCAGWTGKGCHYQRRG